MTARLGLRMALDAAMVPVFVLLMTARYTGVGVHEWLSLLFVLIMAAHLYLNGSWWTALPRLMRVRPCRTLLTLATAVFLAAALISGVPLSEHLSVLTGWKTDLAGRSRHMFFAHWAFLLGAAHIGLCRKRLVSALVRVMPRRMLPYLSAAVLIPALYGVQAFAERELALPLTMTTSFTVWNPDDHLFRLLFDYLAVFCLSASAAGVASFLLERAAHIAMPSRGTCSGHHGRALRQNRAGSCHDRVCRTDVVSVQSGTEKGSAGRNRNDDRPHRPPLTDDGDPVTPSIGFSPAD